MNTQSINIPARPIQRDCISHHIRAQGEFPRTTYIARFEYEDGSIREYDGREWKPVRSPRIEVLLNAGS